MAYVTSRKNTNNEILLLFPIPFYTSSRIYYEEDLEQLGLDRVLDDLRRVTFASFFCPALLRPAGGPQCRALFNLR